MALGTRQLLTGFLRSAFRWGTQCPKARLTCPSLPLCDPNTQTHYYWESHDTHVVAVLTSFHNSVIYLGYHLAGLDWAPGSKTALNMPWYHIWALQLDKLLLIMVYQFYTLQWSPFFISCAGGEKRLDQIPQKEMGAASSGETGTQTSSSWFWGCL